MPNRLRKINDDSVNGAPKKADDDVLTDEDIMDLARFVIDNSESRILDEEKIRWLGGVYRRLRDFIEAICQHQWPDEQSQRQAAVVAEENFWNHFKEALGQATGINDFQIILCKLLCKNSRSNYKGQSAKACLFQLTKAIARHPDHVPTRAEAGSEAFVPWLRRTLERLQSRLTDVDDPKIAMVHNEVERENVLVGPLQSATKECNVRDFKPQSAVSRLIDCAVRCDIVLLKRLGFKQEEIAMILQKTRRRKPSQETIGRWITICLKRFQQG